MAFTVYRSTDTSAPTLTGETGKLNDLLDAILVNGYGSKAAAGWTKPFNTTNAVCVFKNGTGSSGRYWRIRDDGPNVTSTFKEAWIRGYGTKADVNDTADASNTLQFPTAAQKTNGAVIRKSATADSTARVWYCFADARTCILIVQTGDNAGQAMVHYFGDIYTLEGSSTLAAVTACRSTENSAVQTNDALQSFSNGNCYIIQSYTGAGGALGGGLAPIGPMAAPSFSTDNVTFPNGPDGGRYLGQMAVCEASAFNGTGAYRGRLRGVWYALGGQASYANLDTLTGTGALAGRTFVIHKCGIGFHAFETSDTLESN